MECLDDLAVLDLVSGVLPADEVVRADQHLSGCESCRELVASVARARRSEPEAGEPAPGDRVGRFVLEERLGAGAMGVVFTARDPELDRKVALKLLRTEVEDVATRARLQREAQAMARVAHPNVVPVFEVGSERGRVFLAMELVSGATLRAWLLEAPRTPQAIVDVFAQAGRGLHAAHQAGLVHRDFKPDNVLVGRDGRVRVTDFGLARAPSQSERTGVAAAAVADVLLTQTGALLGTPAYMAPEQLAGAPADARSDQFAFAVSLFEALVGRRPFAGRTAAELAEAIAARRLAGPAERVDRRVHAALRRALDPDPDQRFADVSSLLDALAPRSPRRGVPVVALAALAASALGAIWWARSRPAEAPAACAQIDSALGVAWSDSRKAQIGAAFAETAPAFGASALVEVDHEVAGWVSRTRGARDALCGGGPSSPRELERLECLSSQVDELDGVLAGLAGLDRDGVARAAESVSGSLPDLSRCDADALTSLAGLDPTARRAVGEVEAAIARSRAALLLGHYEEAAEAARTAIEAADASGHSPTRGAAKLALADALRSRGQAGEALQRAQEALFAFEEGHDDRGSARAWITMIAIDAARARYDRAAEWGAFATAAWSRAGKPASLEADLRETLGAVALGRDDLDAAQRELERARALADGLGDADPARASRLDTNLGNLFRARGDLTEARAHHQRALDADRARLGPKHPALARHMHNLAGLLKAERRIPEALAAYREALAFEREALGDDHPDVARTLNSLGIVAAEAGDVAQARALYEASIRIYRKHHHAQEAVVQRNLDALPTGPSGAEPLAPSNGPLAASSTPAPSPSAAGGARRPGPAPSTPSVRPSATTGTYMPAPALP